jgi:hypothetical protein
MSIPVDQVIAITLVAAALLYLLWRTVRRKAGKCGGTCCPMAARKKR